VRNSERVAGLRELAARRQRYDTNLHAHFAEAPAFVESGSEDVEGARELLERPAQLEAERDAIYAELRRLDPALSAGLN
jgi:hypothetical protein